MKINSILKKHYQNRVHDVTVKAMPAHIVPDADAGKWQVNWSNVIGAAVMLMLAVHFIASHMSTIPAPMSVGFSFLF